MSESWTMTAELAEPARIPLNGTPQQDLTEAASLVGRHRTLVGRSYSRFREVAARRLGVAI